MLSLSYCRQRQNAFGSGPATIFFSISADVDPTVKDKIFCMNWALMTLKRQVDIALA